MILTGKIGYIKRRPKAHKLEDITTHQHSGMVLAMLPSSYPMTAPQRKVSNVAKECGIKTGMNRRDLIHKMIDCVGPKMKK
jgi:predicted transcriptional regulator